MWNRRKDEDNPQRPAHVPQSPAPAQTNREVPTQTMASAPIRTYDPPAPAGSATIGKAVMIKGQIFGGRLPVAVGAPRLAGLTGAPLLPAFTVRDPKLGWRIVIEPPIAIASDKSSDERCIAAVAEFLRRSEPWVRQFPEQWRAWSKWRDN